MLDEAAGVPSPGDLLLSLLGGDAGGVGEEEQETAEIEEAEEAQQCSSGGGT